MNRVVIPFSALTRYYLMMKLNSFILLTVDFICDDYLVNLLSSSLIVRGSGSGSGSGSGYTPTPPSSPSISSSPSFDSSRFTGGTFIDWFDGVLSLRVNNTGYHNYPLKVKIFEAFQDTLGYWNMTSRTTYIQRYIDSIHENLINQGVNILPLGVNLYFEGSIVTSVTIIVDRAQYLFWVIDPSTYSLTCTVIVQDNDNVLLKRRDITITPNINITPREILRTASEHTVNFLNAGGTLDLPIILARFTR